MRIALRLAVVLLLATPLAAQPAQLIEAARKAMGGARVDAITTFTTRGSGHAAQYDQSERADSGVLNFYSAFVEQVDRSGRRAHRQRKQEVGDGTLVMDEVVSPKVSYSGGRVGTQSWRTPEPSSLQEWLDLNPFDLLRTAAANKPRAGAHVGEAVFTYAGVPATITFDASTHLPASVRLTRPFAPDFYKYWGDVATEYRFTFWSLFAPGVRYPARIDVVQNGELQRSMEVKFLKINEPLDEAPFAPGAMMDHDDGGEAVSLADDIWLVPGRWNSTIIAQPDGVVIIEAAESNARSQAVLAEAARRAPGKKIKAVIATGQMPHYVAGIREYVARGIPIYAMADTATMIRRICRAPHVVEPDALARAPREAVVHVVTSPQTIGAGDTAIELLPQFAAFHRVGVLLTAPHLLYAADFFPRADLASHLAAGQPVRTEAVMWIPVLAAHPDVTAVYGMHLRPTPIAEVRKAIEPVAAILP